MLIDNKYGILQEGWGKFFLAYIVFLGVLMVSNIRYPNFKKVQWNLKLFVLLVLLLLLLFVRPLEVLGSFMFCYLFYGLARWVFLMARIIFKHK